MDPNATLESIRAIIRGYDETSAIDVDDVDTLVTLVNELDGWLTHGGFLPLAWNRNAL